MRFLVSWSLLTLSAHDSVSPEGLQNDGIEEWAIKPLLLNVLPGPECTQRDMGLSGSGASGMNLLKHQRGRSGLLSSP